MMSQIPCKQSIRIEKSGWFKHYFPGNLRRNFLFTVCNYTSYQNLQKTSLPDPFAREKAGDKAGTVSAHGYKCCKTLQETIIAVDALFNLGLTIAALKMRHYYY